MRLLSTGDNPVNRLFALNYVTLGIALMINVLFYRFKRRRARLSARWVQEQTYLYLTWGDPGSGADHGRAPSCSVAMA